MESRKVILPAAQPVSSGSSGVSAPFSILPETIAQQTEALGQAMFQFMAAPAGEHREAAAVLSSKFEDVTQSFDQICLGASSSVQSMTVAAGETLRKSIEQGQRFAEDLAGAKGPLDAIRLQLGFFAAQMLLFAENSKVMQKEFARFFWQPRTCPEPLDPAASPTAGGDPLLRP